MRTKNIPKNKTILPILLSGCVALGFSYSTILLAQSGETKLEEVQVIARKVEENLQETPISISAFSGETLERRQIRGTDDLGKVTPNLEFTNNAPLAGNNSSSQVFIRGIGQVDPAAGVDPGVGLYIDDVYMGQSVGGTMELRDIADVEVLRGPQGTLFGRNTIGGAVLLTTRRPGDEFGGTTRIGVGDFNLVEFFTAVDIPFSSDFKTRFTYGSRTRDGYVTRQFDGVDIGDTDNYTITAKAEWTPSDNWTFKINYDHTEADENGSPLVFAANNPSATFQRVASADAGCPGFGGDWTALPEVPNIDDARCANSFQNSGAFENNGTYPLQSKLENSGMSFHAEYDFASDLSLKYIFADRELNWSGNRDADNTPLTILHTDYDSEGDQTSHELQLIYSGDRITGVTGFYQFEENVTDILTVYLNTPAPGEQIDSDNNIVQNESSAIFTQWSFKFNESLRGTLGVRSTDDTKGSIPDQFNYASPDDKYLEVRLYEADFSETTVSADLSYMVNEENMVYFSYSEGFKGGGWNSHFNVPQSQEALDNFHRFNEETAETVEVGYKADLLDNTLRLNAALFNTDYTDLQFIFRVGVAPYLLNAGEASISGAEIELTWVPSQSWIIEAGIGYLDDSIDSISTDFDALGASTSITTDNTLPYTPEIQTNFGIGYSSYAGNFIISPRVDVHYRDETFFDTANTPEIAQLDTVTTVDASVRFETIDDVWSVVVGINNATDEAYPIAGNSSLSTGSGYAEVAYSRPREYFANFTYNF